MTAIGEGWTGAFLPLFFLFFFIPVEYHRSEPRIPLID
jgi:hypothetical protein